MSQFWLSKSTFIKSLQCKKAFYLNKHHKDLRDEVSEQQEAIFRQGTNVGELAQELFPGGVDVSPENYWDFSNSIKQTTELLANDNAVIYEAAFEFEGVLCALDILVKKDGVITAYEVKSSTSVKEVYEQDATLQYYIMKQCGFEPENIYVVHINNQYSRNGDLDIESLFTKSSVLSEVKQFEPQIGDLIRDNKRILTLKDTPKVDIGAHCTTPYGCDFMGHCWKHIPEYSIFDISGLRTKKKFGLYERGITELFDIPEEYQLSDNQRLQIEVERSGETHIDKEAIGEFLNSLNYPLYFLDFETFQSAVPLFDNSRPYQQLVFQYSLHIQSEINGETTHHEFLANGDGTDPRKGFTEQLIKDCGKKSDVLVYNIGFERGRLRELIVSFPQYDNDLQAIIDRMVDLMIPFQKKHYYAPDLMGSYSIKYVLPSLVPELSYKDLEIQNGGMAMNTFGNMMEGSFEGDEATTRRALIEYCKMDTLAMVRILQRLEELINS